MEVALHSLRSDAALFLGRPELRGQLPAGNPALPHSKSIHSASSDLQASGNARQRLVRAGPILATTRGDNGRVRRSRQR